MLRSMTAYGRGECEINGVHFVSEIRTINHRYRDIHLRLPKNFQILEDELKTQISTRIRRGRVEASVQMDSNNDNMNYNLELNRPLVLSYLKIFDELAQEFNIEKRIHIDTICQMKDVILFQPHSPDVDELKPGFFKSLDLALSSLDEMRLREGEAIERDFRERLKSIEDAVNIIEKKAPETVEDYRKRLKENVDRLLKISDLDEGRLEQEIVIFAERSDITEELVRIKSHLNQFLKYLNSQEANGRRFDFLLQEIHREVNTLSSKASNASISAMVVEIKAELEKLREQAQNVE